ncbi:MAG: hypothetical protein EOO20_13865 [Chryseobacterium sp.]|nr:MAG: hypothetical protein EOO20_13865 [Chryseobacterium sp.]
MALPNLKIIFEDLFQTPDSAVVIPRSTSGTVGAAFKTGLKDRYNFILPEDRKPQPLGHTEGLAFIDHTKNPAAKIAIYLVTCVDELSSDYRTIALIIQRLINILESNMTISGISMPLIGTGAGNLDPVEVYHIIRENWGKSGLDKTLSIYIDPEKQNDERFVALYELIKRDELTSQPLDYRTKENEDIYLFDIKEGLSPRYQELIAAGIWINDYLNFANNVKKIRQGNFILLKRYVRTNQRNHALVIHAVGKLISNDGDGVNLKVDWDTPNLNGVLVPTDHPYNQPMMRVGTQNANKILALIQNWQNGSNIKLDFSVAKRVFAKSTIAGINNDQDRGKDLLGIKADYTSFAKIIAAKNFIPPLSIALFGRWGSGKSFFMRKLDEQITEYAQSDGQDHYCKGIAQIHFNAWSYMDANLWASIVSKIFEGLFSYISGQRQSDKEITNIKFSLNQHLTIASEAMGTIEKEQHALRVKIKRLKNEKKKLRKAIKENIDKVNRTSLFELIKTADKEFKVRETLQQVITEDDSVKHDMEMLKKIIPEKYYQDPEIAYRQAKSVTTFLQEFFRKDRILLNLLFILVGIILIIFVPILLKHTASAVSEYILPPIQTMLFLSTLLIPTALRIKNTITCLSPVISAFWKVKERYRMNIEEVRVKAMQQEKAIKLQISHDENQLGIVSKKIQADRENLRAINFKIDHALATQALYSFVEKRCNSEEYQKHLGIVSIIRKDFEILSELFLGHKNEITQAEGEHFRKLFQKPLERIVLYIDDLDRCPEDRVVEVLEAVNLLMAFPLFVVVVGVDPLWVKKALLSRYSIQFGEEKQIEDLKVSTSDYLEKIFQVPFHLKQAGDISVKAMLKDLFSQGIIATDSTQTEQEQQPSMVDQYVSDDYVNEGYLEEVVVPVQTTEQQAEETHLTLSQWEAEQVQQISPLLGNNPRAIKRFVNIYKIVRAHQGLSYQKDNQQNEFVLIMFLLALYNGSFKSLGKPLTAFLENPDNSQDKMEEFVDRSHETVYGDNLNKAMLLLQGTTIIEVLSKTEVETLQSHNTFIRRFIFDPA